MLFTAPLARLAPAALLAAALVVLGLCSTSAQAGGGPSTDHTSVHVGPANENAYKLGCWCPVRIEVHAHTQTFHGRLELLAPDDEGQPVAYPVEGTFHLENGEKGEATVDVLIGRPAAELRVRIVEENGRVVLDQPHQLQAQATAEPGDFVVLSVISKMGLFEAAHTRQGEVPLHAIHANAPASLPTSWWGYEGIDLVVLSTSDSSAWAQFDDTRLAALTQWVGQGGRLLVSVGVRGEEVLGPGGMLQELSPVTYLGQTQVRESVHLEAFSGSNAPLENVNESGERLLIDIALVDPESTTVLVTQSLRSSDVPLIVQGGYGLGKVTLVLCDFDQPPLAGWPALPVLMSRLCFESVRATQSGDSTQTRRAGHIGYDDIESQLRVALEQFPQVGFVPFWIVALLAVGYIALIGPVDYFLLRWYGRRMGATWITFPLIVVALAVAVVAVGGAAKSSQPAINLVEVIDIDTVEGYVRGNQWAYLYSPSNHRYDITAQLPPNSMGLVMQADQRMGWDGRSGSGFGGMSASGPLASSTGTGYEIAWEGSQAEIEHIPLPASSTRALAARWAGQYEPAAPLELRASPEGFVQGSVVNPLSVELRDAWLYNAEWAYSLGDLPPGSVMVIDETTSAENLNWRLTRRTIRELQDVTTPWDPSSKEVPRILEMILFHQAAGGRTYTRLSGDTTRPLDMSELLGYRDAGDDRAVLWGRVLSPAMEISLGDDEGDVDQQSWTIYRLVLPVTLPESEYATEP